MTTTLILAASLFIECENFQKLGGWTVETQSMRQLGSSYVMAHGYGKLVEDAVTEVEIPEGGKYTLWARTRNWNAEWTKGAAGLFLVDASPSDAFPSNSAPVSCFSSQVLGDGDSAWLWQKAGVFEFAKGYCRIILRDLTGFNGRCDALYLTTGEDVPPNEPAALDAWRRKLRGIEVKDDPETYDLIGESAGADRRDEVSSLMLTDFIDPSVAEPLIDVQDKLGGPGFGGDEYEEEGPDPE